jgi:hypothetical protein
MSLSNGHQLYLRLVTPFHYQHFFEFMDKMENIIENSHAQLS